MKIGRCRLTHSSLLSENYQPICTSARSIDNEADFSGLFRPSRYPTKVLYRFFLNDILERVDSHYIIDFNEDTHFYHQL